MLISCVQFSSERVLFRPWRAMRARSDGSSCRASDTKLIVAEEVDERSFILAEDRENEKSAKGQQ